MLFTPCSPLTKGIYVLDADVCPSFNSKNYSVDIILFSLYLHGHTAIPLIPAPAGTAVHLGRMAGTIPETYALHPAVENDMAADHLNTFSIGLPFASSSTNLSSCRIFFVIGSSISSTLIPHTDPVISSARGFHAGADYGQ